MGVRCRIYTEPEVVVLVFPDDGGLRMPEITHRIADKIPRYQIERLSESAQLFITGLADTYGADGRMSYSKPGILRIGVHRDADPTAVAIVVLDLLGQTSGCDFEVIG